MPKYFVFVAKMTILCESKKKKKKKKFFLKVFTLDSYPYS